MASKRTGKEAGSSSGGPPTKKQRNRYKSFLSKPLHPWRYPVSHTMNIQEISDNVVRLMNNLGWVEMMRHMKGFENFTYEFLSSIAFKKDRLNLDNPNHRVSFRLLNIDYEMSLENFYLEMGFANAGFIHDSWWSKNLFDECFNDIKPRGINDKFYEWWSTNVCTWVFVKRTGIT